jgi:adenylate cyclase
MNIFSSFSFRFRRRLNNFITLLAKKWKGSFFIYLAALFSLLIIADTAYFHVSANMRQVGLDLMVRYRFVVPKPDKDIVIVDIDEASLAAMAKEYGRWPWPRRVIAEFVKQIEKQHPRAIAFDIIFSDPDVYNPQSDAYFDEVIAGTDNTFFPMLRLSPYDDAQSSLNPAMIPGAVPSGDQVQGDATIAMLMPYFNSIQSSGRVGVSNIDPDADGVTRQYQAYIEDYGWKIPSLPLRMAQALNFPETDEQHVFLNWRGPPFTYHSVSFSKVYTDMTSKIKTRPANEFTGKIVIVGSTASGLFDIKPTPMSRSHPGVEILATAIDNFKHVDYLRFPDKRIFYLIITLLVIWTTAWGFYRDAGRDKIDKMFGASQFILIAVSYGSINLSNTYINLTGPVTLGLAYFTVARLYAFATARVLEKSTLRTTLDSSSKQHGVMMLINLRGHAGTMNTGVRENIRKGLLKIGRLSKSVDIIKGAQKGMWTSFEDVLALSWICQPDDEVAKQGIKKDIAEIEKFLLPLLGKHYVAAEEDIDCIVHEGSIAGGEHALDSWQLLFAQALLRKKQGHTQP